MSEEVIENRPAEEENVSFPYVVAVKFKNAGKSYSFGCETSDLKSGDWVVVETAQGVELGEVQAPPLSTEKFPVRIPLKPIIRPANDMDRRVYEENFAKAEEAFRICNEEIEALELKMNLLSADYTLDRTKVLFVYLAEQRVDFRELLKRLGARLHCRIELRQIGERDKARMVGGIGMCGMECCCSRFKNKFDVISINMAKNQLLALNIEKLSGMCGKLMCCLKYEDDNYRELTAGLPKIGAHVEYEGQLYRVISMNVMTDEAKIENPEAVQILTIDELRNKTEVRKGIAAPKAAALRRTQKTTNVTKAVESAKIRQQENQENSLAPAIRQPAEARETHRPEKNRKQQTQKPRGQNQNQIQNQGQKQNSRNEKREKPQNNSNNRKQQAQRPKSMQSSGNPNMTVRSFKSAKTKEKESAAAKGAGK